MTITRFEGKGRLAGLTVAVTWEGGALVDPDPDVQAAVDAVIATKRIVRQPEYYDGEATLEDPRLAIATLSAALDDFRVLAQYEDEPEEVFDGGV